MQTTPSAPRRHLSSVVLAHGSLAWAVALAPKWCHLAALYRGPAFHLQNPPLFPLPSGRSSPPYSSPHVLRPTYRHPSTAPPRRSSAPHAPPTAMSVSSATAP